MSTEKAEFDIRFDPETKILFVELHGFWSLATVAAFTAKAMVAGTAAKIRCGKFGVLSDMSNFPVQSQQVSAAFSVFMRTNTFSNGGRTAVVYATALTRMQAERETPVEGMRFFTDREEAIRWLRNGDGEPG